MKIFFLCVMFASSMYAATSIELCTHLLRRTSFGVEKEALAKCLQNSYEKTVHEMVYNIAMQRPVYIRSDIVELWLPSKKFKDMNLSERKQYRKELNKRKFALKAWWIKEMIETKVPLREMMVLFWHNHFTSSLRKVKQPKLMFEQNQLFRKFALGNYGDLLHHIVRDPAMLIYLDNKNNTKKNPNENLARELLELFTLGEGHYVQEDVVSLSKALTGYNIDKNFSFIYRKKRHDESVKPFLGTKKNINADEAIDIILRQKETSELLVRKLWYYFIDEEIDSKEFDALVSIFKNSDYELKPLIEALLTSQSFIKEAGKGSLVKSPIEYIVSHYRTFQISEYNTKYLVNLSKRMGQDIMDPPNVKGWIGGKHWINVSTLIERKSFVKRFSRTNLIKKSAYLFEKNILDMPKEEFAAKVLLPSGVMVIPSKTFSKTLMNLIQHPLYHLK